MPVKVLSGRTQGGGQSAEASHVIWFLIFCCSRKLCTRAKLTEVQKLLHRYV